MKRRYFAYIRVSTVKQGERGSSLIEQRSAIETYAARNGLTIVGWFEEMVTAAKRGRREFSRMVSSLKSGKANGLIVHKIDRSARNLRDWADLGELIDRGIDIRFASDNFDLLSRGGRLSADIQAVVAADYVRNLRDEVKKGLLGRLKQGIYPFAAPMGYLDTGKAKVTGHAKPKMIDPKKGPLVRELFELYAMGTVSLRDMGLVMWEKGLRARSGKALSRSQLSDVLNNPFYMGVIRIATTRQTFTGAHVPLISKEMFLRVQTILRNKTVPRWRTHRFLLQRMVRCGTCGRRTLTGELHKGITYYRCHGETCPGVSWRGDVLEAAALEIIKRVRLDAGGLGELGQIVEEQTLAQRGDRDGLKAAMSLKLDNVERRMERLTDLLIDAEIDRAAHDERRERLLIEKQGILEQLTRLEVTSPLKEVFDRFELENHKLLRYEMMSVDEKREMLQTIGSNFSVHGKNAVFTLRSPYNEIAELDGVPESGHYRDDIRTCQILEILKTTALTPSPHVPKSTRSSAAGHYSRGDDELAAAA